MIKIRKGQAQALDRFAITSRPSNSSGSSHDTDNYTRAATITEGLERKARRRLPRGSGR